MPKGTKTEPKEKPNFYKGNVLCQSVDDEGNAITREYELGDGEKTEDQLFQLFSEHARDKASRTDFVVTQLGKI